MLQAARLFDVDVRRGPRDDQFGIQVKPTSAGYHVADVRPSGPLGAWNERCRRTFPDDEIRQGDLILLVNGVGPEMDPKLTESQRCQRMKEQLERATEVLMIVRRGST